MGVCDMALQLAHAIEPEATDVRVTGVELEGDTMHVNVSLRLPPEPVSIELDLAHG